MNAATCMICDLEIAEKDRFTCADWRCQNAHHRETAEEAQLADGRYVYSDTAVTRIYLLIEKAPRRMVRIDRLISMEVDEDEAREALEASRDLDDPTWADRTSGCLTDCERNPGLVR